VTGSTVCPSDTDLARLIDGSAPERAAGALTAHLDGCENCRARLDRLAGGTGSWAVLHVLAETAGGRGIDETNPDCVPGYRLVRRLGSGGIGDVFLALQLFSRRDEALRTVALKAIRPEALASPKHRLIMENDIRIAALLDHPNIVRILQVGPAGGPLYYTMPFLPGGSLAERIDRKPLPGRAAAALLLPVVRAVAYLHGQSPAVIHLDLKPLNVLLDADGKPHVADFGLARLLQSENGEHKTVQPAGTPEYMAPEQFDGTVSVACDIYGLGAILYEMLTGRPPFVGATWGHDEARPRARAGAAAGAQPGRGPRAGGRVPEVPGEGTALPIPHRRGTDRGPCARRRRRNTRRAEGGFGGVAEAHARS
jgi:hypothetical protein